MSAVIPFVTKCVRYVSILTPGLTPGKTYDVHCWTNSPSSSTFFTIVDDDGDTRRMIMVGPGRSGRKDFIDASFSKNLEKILEE